MAGLALSLPQAPACLCPLTPVSRGKTNFGAVCYDARVLSLKISDGYAYLNLNLHRVVSIAARNERFILTANRLRNDRLRLFTYRSKPAGGNS